MSQPEVRVRWRWRRWLAGLVVLVLGLPVAATAIVRLPAVRAYAAREAAQVLKSELGLVAGIREVDIDPAHFAVVARDIRLVHPENGPIAQAEVLRIFPSWWALARGALDLHGITIERATLWLKLRDGKIVNLPELPKSQDEDPSLEIPFEWLRVKDSRVVVDAAPWASGELRHVDVRLDATDGGLALRVSTREGVIRHDNGSEQVTRLELEAALWPDRIEVALVRFATPHVRLRVADASADLPFGDRYRGELALDLDVARAAALPHGLELPRLEGQLSVRGEVKADGKGPVGQATVRVHRGLVKKYGIGENVRLELAFDRDRIVWKGVAELIRNGGSVDLRGVLGLGEGLPLEAHLDVNDVSFARLMEQLAVSPDAIVEWVLAGRVSLEGRCDPIELHGSLRMPTREFRVTREAWHSEPPLHRIIAVSSADLAGTVDVRPAGITLSDVAITLPNSRLLASHVLLGFDDQLHVRAEALEWALVDSSPLLDFAMGGSGTFSVDVAGTFSDPTVAGRIDVKDFAFHSFLFGDLAADFEIDRDLEGVRLAPIEVAKGSSRYRVLDGFFDFRQDRFRTGGKVELVELSLADFYHVFHWENDERYDAYSGKLQGAAELEYTLGHPGDSPQGTLVADVALDVLDVSVHGYAFRDGEFRGRWTWRDHAQGYRGGELEIERFFARKGDGTVNLSGRMGFGGVLDVVAVGDRISLRDTEGVRERAPTLRGSYAATAVVKGTLASPRVDVDLVGTGLSLDGDPLGDGRAYVRLTDKSDPWIAEALRWPVGAPPADAPCGHAREGLARGVWAPDPPLRTADGLLSALDQPMAWVLCGEALGGQVRVDMAIGRTRLYPLRGYLSLDELAFGRFLPRRKGGAPMRGSVTGRVVFRGGAALAPETLTGELHLDALSAGQLDVELANDGPVDVHLDRGAFGIDRAEFVGPSSRLALRGGGSLVKGLALDVEGSVDLGLLASVSQAHGIEASGRVDLAFKVSGPVARPAIYGHAALRGGALGLASLPAPLDGIEGNVTFSAQRIVLEGLRAEMAGGRVGVSGVASLRDRSIGSYAFDVEADGITIEPRDGIDMTLGGRGRLAWQNGERLPQLTGTLRIDRLEYTRPIEVARTLEDMTQGDRADVEGYDPDADLLALDVRIVQSKPMHIRNNLIDAELHIEDAKQPFRLLGTDQRYGVLGQMSVREGTVRFRGKEFDVHQGDITFHDETRIDPSFDLRATTDVNRQRDQTSWHVSIHAWGSRDAFRFQLSSDPYLTEDDIALLLAVGMTHSELAQLEAGALTGTAALEALATVTGVEREVQRALPEIDDLHIASAYSERSNRTEPQLFVGKRIADRVRLSASTGIAESRDFSTGVELRLSEETSVEAMYNNQNASSASQLGDVGVDLKWRLEFD